MANQQLVDYINAQRAKGVARDAINAALLGAGWSAADVFQAMDAAFGPPPAASSPMTASPTASAASTTFFKPAASQQPASGPVSFQARPAQSTSPFSSPSSATSPASLNSNISSETVSEEHHVSKPLVAAIIVVVLLAIGGLAYWYFGGAPGAPTPTPGATEQTTLDELTQRNADLQTQAGQMTAQIADLENQLSIFATGTAQNVPLTIRGTIQQASTTKVFTLTTNRNIVVTIANSRDAKVLATLTPLIGASAELQGTHPAASSQLTVTHVNGTSLAAAPIATSTATTSAQ